MEEQRLLNDIFEIIADGIFVVNAEGRLLRINNNFADMLGYKKDELIGKHLLELSPHNYAEFSSVYSAPMLSKLLCEGLVENNQVEFTKKDGSFFAAEVNISGWEDANGNLTRYIGSVRDISERKVWENNLKEKDELLQNIIHADPNLIFVKHRNGNYIEVSESLVQLFGASLDYVIGKTDFELAEKNRLSTEEAENIRADDLEVLDTGKKKFIEEESITQPDGTIKWYQTTKVPLFLNNSWDYLLGVSVDITHRKQITDLLKDKENELESKNRNLEELNAALKVVLRQKDADRIDLEKKVLSNMKTLVEPYLNKLKNLSHDTRYKNLIEIIEANLKEVISSFSMKLSSQYIGLTSSEIQVADLIKKDFSNKEIAEKLNIALETVSSHRKHIRKKLDITNKKTNLNSFLKSLQQ